MAEKHIGRYELAACLLGLAIVVEMLPAAPVMFRYGNTGSKGAVTRWSNKTAAGRSVAEFSRLASEKTELLSARDT